MLRLLFLNTGSNLVVMVVKLAITFIMTPIFVSYLGRYDYGIWEMLAAIIGYMGLLDLGIKPAISRFAAKYHAEKDGVALSSVYSSAMAFMAAVGFVLFLFFSCWAVFFPEVLAEDSSNFERYSILLLVIGIQLGIIFPGYVAESYLEGFQKYYLKNNITIFNSVVGATFIYFCITPDNGLILLAGVNAFGMSVKYLVFIFLLSRRSYGAIRPKLSDFSWERLKGILSFGFKSFVQGVATRLEYATDTLVIGFFLGPAMVPLYGIPANLVQYIRTIGYTLTHAFMPFFSHLSALDEKERIIRIYFAASRYVIGIMLPMSVGACIIGGPFIGIWLGGDFTQNSDAIILLLVLFSAVPFLNPFSSRYLTAIGKHGIFAKLTPISAVINFAASVALVQEYGIIGAALGSVIPVFVFFPIYLRYTCRNLGITVSSYVYKSILPCLLPTLIMAAVVLVFRFQVGLNSYGQIVLSVVIGALVYAVMFSVLALTKEERNYVVSKFFKING